jgi:adenosine deaminase
MGIDDLIRAVPKVELHRHLSGSGRSDAMFAIARRHGLTVEGGDLETFRNLTSMYRTPAGFHTFLAKFKPRARFFTEPGLIAEVIDSVIKDALADNLMYLEARFSASHFARHMGFDLDMVAELIITTARTAAAAGGMDIGFVMVLTRDLGVEENRRMLDVVLSSRLGGHFAGIDIAGDEAGIPLAPYLPLIQAARAGGKRVTIHAGEAGPASNVAEAIAAGAERIGHGINAFRDPGVLALARERGIAFEV